MTDKVKGKNEKSRLEESQEIRFFRKKWVTKENNFAYKTASMKHSNSSIENQGIFEGYTKGSSSEEEHMENALALRAEEGRDKLR